MPQATSYHDLTLDELSNHPVKLGFEFEFASAQSHRRVGEAIRELFGADSVGVVEDCYNAHRHGGYTKWNVTADSSINPTHSAEYRVELVSPILTPDILSDTLTKVFTYLQEAHAVTNTSTGMHVTVSHPHVSDDYRKFDPIKMGLLMDDIGMTQKYRGDLNNHYARSTMALFAQVQRSAFNNHCIQARDVNVPWSGDPELLFLLATKEPRIRRVLIEAEKYRSINLSKVGNHCVEVRSPGGDYLGSGADEAIETARRILSSLVYACIPDAGFDEYRTRFFSFFESRIKPRPCPNLINSVGHVSFALPGTPSIVVGVTFMRKIMNREIDGWTLEHNRATYIKSIRLSSSLPVDDDRSNGIFSPSSSATARTFSVDIQFNAITDNVSLLDENYEHFCERNRGVLPVTPSNVVFSGENLRTVAQYDAALNLVSTIRESLRSSAFKTALENHVSHCLNGSILESGIQRILSFVKLDGSTASILCNNLWTRPLSVLTESKHAAERAAERAAQIVNQDQFSTKLASRLAALRSAATAPAWAGVPVTASEASSTSVDIPSGENPWEAVGNSFENTHFGTRMRNIILVVDSASLGLSPMLQFRVRDTVVALQTLCSNALFLPLLTEMQTTLQRSQRVAQSLHSLVSAGIPAIGSEYLRTLSVDGRMTLVTDCIRLAIVVSRIRNAFTSTSTRMEPAFASWLARICTRVGTILATLDSMHGQVAIVHSPVRLATMIHIVASENAMEPLHVLSALENSHVADTILRPTHVGRIRAELTRVAAPDEQDDDERDDT